MQFTKTRIAPTPSGYLHLGNVLSFAITAAWGEMTGASILLRIDDLDQERTTKAYVQDIFDTLNFMEIPWQEGPKNMQEFEQDYSQHHRLPLYRQALQVLQEGSKLFACSCSRSRLQQTNGTGYPGTCIGKNISLVQEEVSWRIETKQERPVTLHQAAGEAAQLPLPASMQHFVVRKKDGYPSYQLTSLVDDLHFGIDLIVRGADLLASTIAQLYLAESLQQPAFQQVRFYHHPLLTGEGGLKLSKSAGDTSLQSLRKQGYTATMIYGMIAKTAGIQQPVSDWRSLAKAFIYR